MSTKNKFVAIQEYDRILVENIKLHDDIEKLYITINGKERYIRFLEDKMKTCNIPRTCNGVGVADLLGFGELVDSDSEEEDSYRKDSKCEQKY